MLSTGRCALAKTGVNQGVRKPRFHCIVYTPLLNLGRSGEFVSDSERSPCDSLGTESHICKDLSFK